MSYTVKGLFRAAYDFIGSKTGKPRTALVVTTKSINNSHVKSR